MLLQSITMNASDYITVLASWLRSIGVTVELYAHDLPHYGGLYRSETREIFLRMPGAEDALMTLAHEAGHHIGYVLAGERNDSRPALHRERQAYVYGWRVIRLIGGRQAHHARAMDRPVRRGPSHVPGGPARSSG